MGRPFKRKRGFFTLAQNTATTDYVRLAYCLALSLKATQREVPYLSIGVTADVPVPAHYRWAFDEIVEIPWGDAAKRSDWKLENEWKAIWMTPYEHTIKLDADMLFPTCIDTWWPVLETAAFWPAMHCLTYRGERVSGDYRKMFVRNELPNVYTAFMYFDHSETSQQVFALVETIFKNWTAFSERYLDEQDRCSTDVVFALALKLLDITPDDWFPTLVHMKSRIQNWAPEVNEDCYDNWLEHIGPYLTDDLILKIGAFRQVMPFHYHLKDFVTDDMIEKYEQHVGRQ